MKTFLLSKNKKYSNHWNEIIENSIILDNKETLTLSDKDILIIEGSLYKEHADVSAKLIVLDTEPTFENSMQLLKNGVKAYGNVYMHSSYILSAIESLRENKIWLYPDFVAKMITLSNLNEKSSLEEKIAPLSKREKEIAKLILDGLTNKEIAINLNISPTTIKIHTKNIYKKLNVTDRLSLFSFLNK